MNNLQPIVSSSDNIVFFGGAGVSTESGIPDFRSADGLYNQLYKYPPEMILSLSFFISHTEEFYAFYKSRIISTEATPNKAHYALAGLEAAGKLKAVVTQNIDGFHQMAGSKNVLELHGSVHRNYCMDCGKSHDIYVIKNSLGIPRCECSGIIKPDVVLYEEHLNVDVMETAIKSIAHADVLIVGGTSLSVYPAAGLLRYFGGSRLVLINRDATPLDSRADLVINDNIGDVLSKLSY